MIRSIAAACLLAALAGPASAQAPLPPPRPADCSMLERARAGVRAAALPLGYEVRDLDGQALRAFAATQGVPSGLELKHATVITDRRTGRVALLFNDGPRCAFNTLATSMIADGSPLRTALEYLRWAH